MASVCASSLIVEGARTFADADTTTRSRERALVAVGAAATTETIDALGYSVAGRRARISTVSAPGGWDSATSSAASRLT